ncbi:MAG: exonuclease domain-containing protein [Lachnospira sp.]|nr:exonuclease domain-containing protein [Lachnospira sp.]
MNYIVLDLEWNQSAKGKEYSISSMPFEIIQIGAVKLNDKFEVIGEFDRLIRPQVYKTLHSVCSEITEITQEMLLSGEHFVDAAEDFLSWCGSDYIFCTWGNGDLLELQRNMNHYGMDNKFPMPFLFYDVQKLYSICFSKGKSRLSLQAAVQELKLEENERYHAAICDARYTARVMKHLDFSSVEKFYSIDTYRVPRNRKEEITMNFGNYSKYISKTFDTRERAANDRGVRSCRCFLCGKPMVRMVKWFATNSKNYYAMFICEEHGFIKGKLSTKSTDDDKYFAVKILKCTDADGVEKIYQKRLQEREHRRQKRLNKSK